MGRFCPSLAATHKPAAPPRGNRGIMPKVSIVMTSYNQERFVRATIESVLAQVLRDWELVVVDDGSRDQSHEIACAYSSKDPRIRCFKTANGGHSSALNFGVRHTRPDSPFIFFLDGDDMLKPDYLLVTVAYLDEHPCAGVVCCLSDQIDGEGNVTRALNHRSRWVPGRLGLPRQLKSCEFNTPFVAFYCATGQGMTGLYRRSIYDKTEGWDIDLSRHEDTDMYCQMSLLAEIHHIPRLLYSYRTHGANITRISDDEAIRRKATFVRDGYARFRQKWCRRVPRNAEEEAILSAAQRHYYGVHRPLRHLKVGAKTLRLAIRERSLKRIPWAFQLMRYFIADTGSYWILGRANVE